MECDDWGCPEYLNNPSGSDIQAVFGKSLQHRFKTITSTSSPNKGRKITSKTKVFGLKDIILNDHSNSMMGAYRDMSFSGT
jgi:hypothetical protein